MIKFPKVHIATSVVNRILNVRDEVDARAALASRDPAVPDPAAASAVLDAKLSQPTPDVGDGGGGGERIVAEGLLEGLTQ